jgi:CPA2 family monovalent cation:H+ antiporter-2
MGGGFLFQAIIYLAAAVICVPLAKRLGMGSVLGYLIAGILIGPYVLGFIGEEGEDIMHFAEFGVVMMLFLIGLELEPAKLWKMRVMIMGVGLSQVVVSSFIFFVIALAFKLSWQSSLAIGLSLSLSSTAIVLQSLKEKNQLGTVSGQHSFSVLLLQDIAVIPILAILPLLAVAATMVSTTESQGMLSGYAGWVQTLSLIGAVSLVILIGRYAIVPLLRIIARTGLRELFTASALLIVVGIAFLMGMVGLSPALGTFLAGVILANSEFKHELETDLDPFKGLLLGLFFIAVGASINFGLIADKATLILSITVGIILIKTLVLLVIGKFSKLSFDQNLLFAIGLSQVGEFAFVTFAFARQLSILVKTDTDMLMAVVALSMTVTPVMILAFEKFILPGINVKRQEEKPDDVIEEKNKVIIAGFSDFGSTIGRFLRANGVNATILDHDSDRVDFLRKLGFKVYFGDATRADLLASAGAADATILISAIDSPDVNLQLVETVKKHFPHLELMIRAENRIDAYELSESKVENIYREYLDSSIRLSKDVLIKLGHRAYTVHRAAQSFFKYDEDALKDLAKVKHQSKEYISLTRLNIAMQEKLLSAEVGKNFSLNDHAWDSESIKESITPKA